MRKKIFKFLCICFCCLVFTGNIFAASNDTTLKDLKDKLAKEEAKMNSIQQEKDKVQKKIKEIQNELESIAILIDKCEKDIESAKRKIEELKKEIENKQLEIDNLISFKQISSGDNVYLEYIFNAKTFTDFIYRVSVVEQLSAYNDGLIDDMNKLIKETEKAKDKLEEKIEENEKNSINLTKTFKINAIIAPIINGANKPYKNLAILINQE
jgi:peptidoglycan hydrolase CwlO-like protein